jgi:hypothetical protein
VALVSAPPGTADGDRWARLLVGAEVARRGGEVTEVRRRGTVRLRVRAPSGDATEVIVHAAPYAGERGSARVPRIVVEAGSDGVAFSVIPAPGEPAGGWELLGL